LKTMLPIPKPPSQSSIPWVWMFNLSYRVAHASDQDRKIATYFGVTAVVPKSHGLKEFGKGIEARYSWIGLVIDHH